MGAGGSHRKEGEIGTGGEGENEMTRELEMEAEHLFLKIGKIMRELEVRVVKKGECVRVVKERCKFDLVAVGNSECGW